MLFDTAETAPPDLAQNGILARKVAEKCRLADFQGRDDVFHPRVLVTILAKQADRSVDNLLPQPRLFALAKSSGLSMAGAVRSQCTGPSQGCCLTRGLQ